MPVMAISSTMNMAFFTFAVMTVAIRAFDNTSRALSIMPMPVPVPMISLSRLNVNGHKNHTEGQKCQIRLHLFDNVFTESRQNALTDLELKVVNLKGLFGKVQSLTLKKKYESH